jgi:uncharacterized protein (DUF1330 family)
MAGYLIANIEVTDAKGFEEYLQKVAPLIAQFGERYIVRGGDLRVTEHTWRGAAKAHISPLCPMLRAARHVRSAASRPRQRSGRSALAAAPTSISIAGSLASMWCR